MKMSTELKNIHTYVYKKVKEDGQKGQKCINTVCDSPMLNEWQLFSFQLAGNSVSRNTDMKHVSFIFVSKRKRLSQILDDS